MVAFLSPPSKFRFSFVMLLFFRNKRLRQSALEHASAFVTWEVSGSLSRMPTGRKELWKRGQETIDDIPFTIAHSAFRTVEILFELNIHNNNINSNNDEAKWIKDEIKGQQCIQDQLDYLLTEDKLRGEIENTHNRISPCPDYTVCKSQIKLYMHYFPKIKVFTLFYKMQKFSENRPQRV